MQIKSFFNLLEQNGGRVTKVYNNTCTCIFIMVMQRHNCYFKAYKLYYMQLKMIVDDGDMYCFKLKKLGFTFCGSLFIHHFPDQMNEN